MKGMNYSNHTQGSIRPPLLAPDTLSALPEVILGHGFPQGILCMYKKTVTYGTPFVHLAHDLFERPLVMCISSCRLLATANKVAVGICWRYFCM